MTLRENVNKAYVAGGTALFLGVLNAYDWLQDKLGGLVDGISGPSSGTSSPRTLSWEHLSDIGGNGIAIYGGLTRNPKIIALGAGVKALRPAYDFITNDSYRTTPSEVGGILAPLALSGLTWIVGKYWDERSAKRHAPRRAAPRAPARGRGGRRP